MDPLLSGLTDAQAEAVTHFEGPLLILAGPGSGKTRVVTHRVAWLLRQNVSPQQILALTFTNKAADEMGRRITQLADDPSVWVGTFHRFCARTLRKYASLVGLQENYTIYDVGDSNRALRQVISQLKLELDDCTPESIAKAISWAKNNLISPEQYQPRAGHPLGTIIRDIYPAYQNHLAASNAVDFDDLLLHVAAMLRENPEVRASLDERYRFILLDEYQDTNFAQYAIARALSIDHANLAVTGDPDQSIYGWRGANLSNILDFERDYPEVHVVRLEQNYRSTQRILRVASDLISRNVRRKEKGLFTDNGHGVPVRLTTYATHKDEADGIAARIAADIHRGRRRPSDFAIFYRVNALSRAFEFALRDLGVPYQMVNGLEFFQRKEIKDILAYLHLLNNPKDEVALLRVINTPIRGIGKTTITRLSDHARQHGLTVLEAARQARQVAALGARPAALVARFVELVDRLTAAISEPLEKILKLVFSETGYQKLLRESNAEEDQERLANIEELLTVARDFDERRRGQLEAFLEETCLVNDTDAWEVDADRVTLMTLHASKGLEFPVVYLTAVEEGILPHERCREHDEQREEERRLMFVGITRARQELQISLARNRDFRGQRKPAIASSFLMDLPRGEMDLEYPEAAQPGGRGTSVADDDHACPFPTTEDWEEPHAEDVAVEEAAHEIPDRRADLADQTADLTPGGSARARPCNDRPAIRLTTAARLAEDRQSPAEVDPEVFRRGLWVLHAAHGLGQIVAINGNGARRSATIVFPHPTGRKTLLLSEGALQPVGGAERETDRAKTGCRPHVE